MQATDLEFLALTAYFFLCWFLFLRLSAQASGWTVVALTHRCRTVARRLKWYRCSGHINNVYTQNCTSIASNEDGLYVRQTMPFSWFHAPLFFCWKDLWIKDSSDRTLHILCRTVRFEVNVLTSPELVATARLKTAQYPKATPLD
jgi:hypothetical protein